MFDKIPSRALSETVAQRLLAQIDSGAFQRGGKLPTESALAQEFGVSRTVIREAVSRLRNEGVVEPRQGSGVYVSNHGSVRPLRIDYAEAIEGGSVLQILALRRAIEAEAASEAAMRRTDSDVLAIDSALQRIDAAVAAGHDGVDEDVAFHRSVAAVAGNPYFLKTLTFLNQYLHDGVAVTRRNEALSEEFSRQVRDEHAAIAASVRAGNPMAARSAVETHMYNAARRLAQAGIC
ncbi:FadR/GntR family transcriptional regulator [Paraburkholderia phenoliruptrix]|uniref:FadR/GntR family transcriptional regulator n=1 Tax=Paraburkholderia phenoliruptrix TaxID=252970 RepID=UPI0039B62691